ncbi:unnamed protein product [Blepharisma stoltei]|uniref:Uncharacterized protein n=1 Tax=Blepharisma stoltei TaxID=1481888 RepID=A0AAU9J5M2_9CILI|nr:unnamed protein product [Blepharisma stoltei]
MMLEDHLALGLIIYRPSFTRVIRLFTLVVIIIFELLLEGLLLFGSENISARTEIEIETFSDGYEAI